MKRTCFRQAKLYLFGYETAQNFANKHFCVTIQLAIFHTDPKTKRLDAELTLWGVTKRLDAELSHPLCGKELVDNNSLPPNVISYIPFPTVSHAKSYATFQTENSTKLCYFFEFCS